MSTDYEQLTVDPEDVNFIGIAGPSGEAGPFPSQKLVLTMTRIEGDHFVGSNFGRALKEFAEIIISDDQDELPIDFTSKAGVRIRVSYPAHPPLREEVPPVEYFELHDVEQLTPEERVGMFDRDPLQDDKP